MAHADDEALPGHKRMGGSLRQNRLAWLVLVNWLVAAKYISREESHRLNAAHLETRTLLARTLTERQHENRPGMIFMTVLRELIELDDYIIERPGMTCARCGAPMKFTDQAWYCTGVIGPSEIPCPYHIRAEKIIGVTCLDGSIGIFAERAFQAVSRIRNDQRQPFAFSATAIWQQLDADGMLKAKDKERYPVYRKVPTRFKPDGQQAAVRVLLLKDGCLDENRVEGLESLGSLGSLGSCTVLPHQEAEPVMEGHGGSWDLMGSSSPSHGIFSAAKGHQDPKDPIRSHAWDLTSSASQCVVPHQDPKDPMNYTPITRHARAHASGPSVVPIRPRVTLVRPPVDTAPVTPQEVPPGVPITEQIADLESAVARALAMGESSLTRLRRQKHAQEPHVVDTESSAGR